MRAALTAPVLALVLALALGAGAQTQAQTVGGWKISDEPSILDGTHRYIATLEGDLKVFGEDGPPATPLLSLECSWNGFSIRIIWPDGVVPAEGSSLVETMWKLDDGPVARSLWGVTGGSGVPGTGKTLAQGGQSGADWTRRLVGAKKLIIRVPDRHGGQETSFTLAGLAPIMDHVTQGCGR